MQQFSDLHIQTPSKCPAWRVPLPTPKPPRGRSEDFTCVSHAPRTASVRPSSQRTALLRRFKKQRKKPRICIKKAPLHTLGERRAPRPCYAAICEVHLETGAATTISAQASRHRLGCRERLEGTGKRASNALSSRASGFSDVQAPPPAPAPCLPSRHRGPTWRLGIAAEWEATQ